MEVKTRKKKKLKATSSQSRRKFVTEAFVRAAD
jgi:hypothetical protein